MLSIPTAMNGMTRDFKNLKAVMLVAVLIVAAFAAFGVIDSEHSDADASASISLNKTSVALKRNAQPYSAEVEATITGMVSGDTLQVTSNRDNVATGIAGDVTSGKSIITISSGTESGAATITVKLVDADNKEKAKATLPVTVKAAVTSIDIMKGIAKITTLSMKTGEEETVTAKAKPDDAPQGVTWSTSNANIATVDGGKIKAVAAGEVTITATSTDDNTKKATLTVTVKDIPVSSITVDKKEATIKMRETVTLKATILPENATKKDVDVTTDKPSLIGVKSITTSGNVITIVLEGKPADESGTATVTITTKDGGKTATSMITVERVAVKGVELNDDAEELEVDEVYDELVAKIDPSNATNQKVTWASSNTSVATVDENGHVKAVSPGMAIITVKTDEGGFTDSCEITVLKTFTIMGTIDSTGNVLNPDSLVKTINETVAKGLYPSFSVLAVLSESVSMSSEIVQALQKANGGEMAIATINGSIYFDENAIDRVDASGKTAGITFTDIPSETYPKFGECYVYEISVTKDGQKHPTSFGATGPKIAIPHELEEGEDAAKLKVALVYGDGNALMLRNYSLVTDEDEETAVVFEPPHMSTFMYMFHDSEYISTDSFDIVFVALFLVLVLALGGGVAFLEFHSVASEKFMNLFDNPNKPPKRPRFPGRSRKNEYDDYYNNDYYR